MEQQQLSLMFFIIPEIYKKMGWSQNNNTPVNIEAIKNNPAVWAIYKFLITELANLIK